MVSDLRRYPDPSFWYQVRRKLKRNGFFFSKAMPSLMGYIWVPMRFLCIWRSDNKGMEIFGLCQSFVSDKEFTDLFCNHQSKTKYQKKKKKKDPKTILRNHNKAKSQNTSTFQAHPNPANKSGSPLNYRIPSRTRRKGKGIYGSSQSCRLWLVPKMSSLLILRHWTQNKQHL